MLEIVVFSLNTYYFSPLVCTTASGFMRPSLLQTRAPRFWSPTHRWTRRSTRARPWSPGTRTAPFACGISCMRRCRPPLSARDAGEGSGGCCSSSNSSWMLALTAMPPRSKTFSTRTTRTTRTKMARKRKRRMARRVRVTARLAAHSTASSREWSRAMSSASPPRAQPLQLSAVTPCLHPLLRAAPDPCRPPIASTTLRLRPPLRPRPPLTNRHGPAHRRRAPPRSRPTARAMPIRTASCGTCASCLNASAWAARARAPATLRPQRAVMALPLFHQRRRPRPRPHRARVRLRPPRRPRRHPLHHPCPAPIARPPAARRRTAPPSPRWPSAPTATRCGRRTPTAA